MAHDLHNTHDAPVNHLLVTVAAVTLLICAALVSVFAYLQLPMLIASGAALAVLLGGSILCWRSFLAAQAILMLSLLVIEVAIMSFENNLLAPFAVLDIVVLGMLLKIGKASD